MDSHLRCLASRPGGFIVFLDKTLTVQLSQCLSNSTKMGTAELFGVAWQNAVLQSMKTGIGSGQVSC